MTSVPEPKWINKVQTLYIHEQSIARYGGRLGARNEGLLESALARAENFHAYGETDLCKLAAVYAVGIARNHAFIDGNKRTEIAGALKNGIDSVKEEMKFTQPVKLPYHPAEP